MSKIVKNTTGSNITVSDVGNIIVPASSQYAIPPQDYDLWSASTAVDTYIDAGSLVINDGYDDLKPVNGKRHLHEEGLVRPSNFLSTASVLATTNSTLTLAADSRLLYLFTGTTAGQIVKLGNATTYNIGHKYEIWNTSSQSIFISNYSGTTLFELAVQQKTWVVLLDNTTQNGNWLIESNYTGIGGGGGNALMGFGFDGNASSGRWLEIITNVASNISGYVIAGSKTVRAISIAGATGSTYTATATIYKNGVALDTISLSSSRKNTKLNLSYALVNLDEMSAQITSGSVSKPIVILWL